MKNISLLILLVLLAQGAFSQIRDCSACSSKVYSEKDISHLSLLELKILRNEIFARQQYVFKDERLQEYFSRKYDWYKPDFNKNVKIDLNEIESQNINLFQKVENEKEILKQTIIHELEKFKSSLNTNETANIESVLNDVTQDYGPANKNTLVTELKNIVSAIDISEIHWYNENGFYKVTTDNGFSIREISITIKGKEILLTYKDVGYSELLNDETAFDFGSDYYSENEYASWFTFTCIDGKLTLIKHEGAG